VGFVVRQSLQLLQAPADAQDRFLELGFFTLHSSDLNSGT